MGGERANPGSQQQQSAGGRQQGGGPGQAPEGLRYGGEAEHGHAPTHVGGSRTIGPSNEPRRQPRTGGETPADWPERHRTYPQSQGGHEQYGQGHPHGDRSEGWVLGRPAQDEQG